MKLSVERDALLDAIAHATRIVSRRDTIPVLKHGLFSAANNALRIRATNLDLVAETRLPGSVTEPGEATLPIAAVSDLVKRYAKGSVVCMDLDPAGPMTLTSGRSKATLPTLSVADFPHFDIGAGASEIVVPASDLRKLLGMTATSADPSHEKHYFYRGIGLHYAAHDGTFRSVASDGARLIRVRVPAPMGAEQWPAVTLLAGSAKEIAALAEEHPKESIKLTASAGKVRAEASSATLTSKLLETRWPDYERITPQSPVTTIRAQSDELGRAMKRALIAATDRNRTVRVDLADSVLSISARDSEGAAVHEEIDVEVMGEPSLRTSFDGRYVAHILTALASDTVQIAYEATAKPLLFTGGTSEDVACLVSQFAYTP